MKIEVKTQSLLEWEQIIGIPFGSEWFNQETKENFLIHDWKLKKEKVKVVNHQNAVSGGETIKKEELKRIQPLIPYLFDNDKSRSLENCKHGMFVLVKNELLELVYDSEENDFWGKKCDGSNELEFFGSLEGTFGHVVEKGWLTSCIE